MFKAAILLLAAATFAACANAAPQPTFCKGSQLSGRFNGVLGSAGAGNISYKLTLKNLSNVKCQISGLPQGTLLGKTGKVLPTHITAEFPQGLTAILVRLSPGHSTTATARFSPDVPGPGEPASGRNCEPVAYTLRVSAPGGGTTLARIVPPTSVCEHGSLRFSAYSTG